MLLRLLCALALLALPAVASAADDFGPHSSGQTVYDRLGALSPADVSRLEERIGSRPYVVYLRTRSASALETESDARALMDAWNVESSSGAKDGAVVFVNFDPADSKHGQVAIYAGQSLHLSATQLKTITDGMAPSLRAGNTEQALEQAVGQVQSAAASSTASGATRDSQPPWGIFGLILGGLSLFFLVPLFIIGIAIWTIVRAVRRGVTSGSGGGWTDWGSSSSSSSFSSGDSGGSSSSDGGSSGSSSF